MVPLLVTIFFLTLFWQTRLPICCSNQHIDYAIPFVYLSDLFFVLWAGFVLLDKERRVSFKKFLAREKIRRLLCWAGGFLLAGLITNLVAADHQVAALYRWSKILEMLALSFLIGWWINRQRERESLLWKALLWGLFPLTLLALAEFILQRSVGLQWLGEWRFSWRTPGIATFFWQGRTWLRPYATFPHPNVLGGVLVVLTYLLYRRRELFSRTVFYLLGVLLPFVLLLTFSRLSWVTFLIVLGGDIVYSAFNKNLPTWEISRRDIVIITGLVAGLLLFLPGPIISRVTSLLNTDTLSISRRAELARLGGKILLQRPILGVGMNQFPFLVEEVGRPIGPSLWTQPIHNIFLLVAVENGLVGFFLALGFICFLLRDLIKALRCRGLIEEQSYLLLILAAIFLTGMWDHYWWTAQAALMLLGVILGVCYSYLYAD